MNVQAVKGNPDEAFVEVFKYALKFSELTTERNIEAYKALQGRRLVFSGGSLWGVKIPESLLDDVPLEKLPYISLFFRYIKGAYMLEHEGHYSPVIEEEDEKLTPEEEEQQEQDRLFIKQQIYRLKKQDNSLSEQQA